jgi:hypothetical protein
MRKLLFMISCLATLSPAVQTGHAQAQASGGWDAWGQNSKRAIEIQGSLGYSNFLDEDPLPHFVAGFAPRFRLFRGLGFQPEVTYMYRSERDRDILFVPNFIWEIRRRGRVIPYVIVGVGVLNHRERFPHFSWSASTTTYGGGVGSKIFLTRRMFLSPEVRFGWEPFIRVTGTIGFVLTR